jgi:hypothetical protein
MKSPIVTDCSYVTEKDSYTDLQVLQSGAGYYVGTMYHDKEGNYDEPGSRDSRYFKTKEEAATWLSDLEAGRPVEEQRFRP